MLRRATPEDIPRINEILNHPSVYPGATMGMDVGPLNVEPVFENVVVLMREDGMGHYLLDPYSPHAGEIHTCFLPEARGVGAEEAGFEAIRFCFASLAWQKIYTRVLASNKGADLYVRQAGFVRISDTQGIRSYVLHRDRWPQVDKSLEHAVPLALEALSSEEHFRKTMGAFCLMGMKEFIGNGVAFYNEHARLHGYPRMDVVGPESVLVGGRLIHFEETGSIRVEELTCQQPEPSQA